MKIFIRHTMVAYTTEKRNLIKESEYDNAVTEWQNNPEAYCYCLSLSVILSYFEGHLSYCSFFQNLVS